MGQQKKVVIGEAPKGDEKKVFKQDIKKKKDIPGKKAKTFQKKTELKQEAEAQKAVKPREGKAKVRSQRYKSLSVKMDKTRIYSLGESVAKVKELASARFDETIELHIKLRFKKGEADFREMIEFPSGLAKRPRVVIIDSDKIDEIKNNKINFDIILAKPSDMVRVAQIAKILGPKGLMPNPKLGTVTDEPEKIKQKLETKLRQVRSDDLGNIHAPVGKVSWADDKLVKNIEAVFGKILRAKIEKATLCSTMGPSVRVE